MINIGSPLFDSAADASSCRTSQCSRDVRLPSSQWGIAGLADHVPNATGALSRTCARDRTADGKMHGNDFVRRAIERRFLSAFSASHLDMIPPRHPATYAIEAVKPLSPPDSWGDCVVADIGLGTVVRIAALYVVPPPMEDSMCWEMDYRFLAEQKKAQETRIKEEQRAGVIDKLLSEANRQSESTDATPVKEVAPAK
jgi:hypothetical protein